MPVVIPMVVTLRPGLNLAGNRAIRVVVVLPIALFRLP